MKLGTRTQYAVLALLRILDHTQTTSTPLSLQDIARAYELSPTYLEKLLSSLRQNGIVKSVRGHQGGYYLARPAAEIHIAHIMHAVCETFRATRCSNNGEGCLPSKERCQSHHLWVMLEFQIAQFLTKISLHDVYANKIKIVP